MLKVGIISGVGRLFVRSPWDSGIKRCLRQRKRGSQPLLCVVSLGLGGTNSRSDRCEKANMVGCVWVLH